MRPVIKARAERDPMSTSERKAIQTQERLSALRDYERDRATTRERMERQRAERLAREALRTRAD